MFFANNVVMDVLRSTIRKRGLEGARLDPDVCSPFDYFSFKRDRAVVQPWSDKVALPAERLCVNAFW